MTYTVTTATIESLDHEGQGVAHVDGKTIFINGALPYETVVYSSYRKKPSFENADTSKVLKASFMRTTPRCPHFGVCGGKMWHSRISAIKLERFSWKPTKTPPFLATSRADIRARWR